MLVIDFFLKIKFSRFLQTHFTSPIPIRMKKKNAPPSLICHGLPENAFQVNQLYNDTWSSKYLLRTFITGIELSKAENGLF